MQATKQREGAVITELRRLESENERLRSEIAQFRQHGRLSEGNHEVLPVVVAATVDLSRIDTSLVTQISSFLGTSRELLNLALTCKWMAPVHVGTGSVLDGGGCA